MSNLSPPTTTDSQLSPVADEPFTVRKEFIPRSTTLQTYWLLSISSANVIKLSGFPAEVLASLKKELQGDDGKGEGIKWERKGEAEARDEVEWWLIGKPWKDKQFTSEILLVLLFSHLISHSYRFVAFLPAPTASDTHLVAAFTRPLFLYSEDSETSGRGAFAISFPSASLLHVVNAPLEETPGILAVVRNGFAKNAKDERGLGDGCYEFKLKSSGLFSSPMSDAARNLLSLDLLHSFDKQGLKLITVAPLNGADIWLFECSSSIM